MYIINTFLKIFFDFEHTKNLINYHYDELNKIIRFGVEEAKQLNELYGNEMNKKSKKSVINLSKFFEVSHYSRIIILIGGNFCRIVSIGLWGSYLYHYFKRTIILLIK